MRRLDCPTNFAFSPEYPRTSSPAASIVQAADIKPSDLCLEVSSKSVISGTFALPLQHPARMSGQVIRSFKTGVSATDDLAISLRTTGKTTAGVPLFFNFITADWETSSTNNKDDIYIDSSSLGAVGIGVFNTREFTANPLIGIVEPNDDGEYDLQITLSNITGDKPAFIKNLRVNSTPKTLAEENQEVITFTQTDPASKWRVLTKSGQSLLIDLGTQEVFPSHSNTPLINTLGTHPMEGMYLASGSCHASDSDYRFYLLQSQATSSVASPGGVGQAHRFNLINIVDDACVVADTHITGDRLTSESYVNTERFDIVNQPHLEWSDDNTVYPHTNYIHPGACIQSPAKPAVGGTLNQSDRSLIIASVNSPGGGNFPSCQLSYTENLKDISLPLSATQRSFTIQYNQYQDDTEPTMKWRACATTKDGAVVWWDGTNWDEYDTPPVNDFQSALQRGSSAQIKTATSKRYDITNERFDDTTKIKTSIIMFSWNETDLVTLLNWKFYTNGPYPEMDMPEFPAPNQTTVQSPVSPYAELGHYTNQIALSASLSAVNLDRAMGNINWAPSAGLWTSGTEHKSALNKYDVINSDGYVLFGFNGPLAVGRPSAPYYPNGFNAASSTSSMTYTLDVSSGALDYFQMQGGVGGMGLHTFNVGETYRKLKDNGHALSAIYDVSGATANSLYKLTDVTRNPVFRLATKKVFRTPLSFTSGANKFIRLSWEIRFI